MNICLDVIYPLDAPGMPGPGPDFLEAARALAGDDPEALRNELEHLIMRALREPGFTLNVAVRPGLSRPVMFIPGHLWGEHAAQYMADPDSVPPVTGPHSAQVMVIGKMPGRTEVKDRRCLVGESGRLLLECLKRLHARDVSRWYVTNLCKFAPPENTSVLKRSWIKDCLPLLHQELRLVRPRYILCLGADASKALLGTRFNVSSMDGRVIEYVYPVGREADDASTHTALVMTVVHPAQVTRAPDMLRVLERGLARFLMLVSGVRFDLAEKGVDHRAIRSIEELEALFREIEYERTSGVKTDDWIALDAEWHGEHPQNRGSYVRTIQLAWREKHAAAVILSEPGGKPALTWEGHSAEEARLRAVELFNSFLRDKRVCGHFFVADLEWLLWLGITEALERWRVPLYDRPMKDLPPSWQQRLQEIGFGPDDIVPACMLTLVTGGWDTGLAAHAIEEMTQLGLEVLATRYTTAPRYDIQLQHWKERYCRQHKLKMKDLEGYGDCPDEILVPYGCYDADVTYRLRQAQEPYIDRDYEGNCCREPFWESMLVGPVILEMHREGVIVDRERMDYLTRVFMQARDRQEQLIRQWANWPDFNLRSVFQVREFLYGEAYNGKRDSAGRPVRLRPPQARCLDLQPILDTSKPPRPWSEIRERGVEDEHTPGTGKTVLSVLAADNPDKQQYVQWIRDYRFLDQVLKSVLRPPQESAGSVEDGPDVPAVSAEEARAAGALPDNLSGVVSDSGLAAVICDDGRVRTHFYPTTETGRWRSARPNLQNLSKRRDADYSRLLGDDYRYTLRSMIVAPPGHVLIEADYKGAELFGMAVMSGDPHLLEHCLRNQLDESDKDYYDIHSNIAVRAFKLNCPPTKKGLAAANKLAARVAAKAVIFGVAYGRGARAIALQCKEEGNPVSEQEAQKIIDTVFSTYPDLYDFLEQCRQRVHNPRWIASCFGRYRRFPYTDDRALLSEFERQAMNFPIQSLVASCVDRALAALMDWRDNVERRPDLFRFALQIHDAVVLVAPIEHARRIVKEVIPLNMTERVDIRPCDLDGNPCGDKAYHMGVDIGVYGHWGEEVDLSEIR